MSEDYPQGISPEEVVIALKVAFQRGSWDAIDYIIETLERVYGEVSTARLHEICSHESKEAYNETLEALLAATTPAKA